MATADFRQIAFEDGPRNCDGLFRAAVSAFCAIPRPSANEIRQLDDLSLGLYGSVSREGLRYAATVLSKCSSVPPGLLRRLCDEPVDISAPLLIGYRALTDIDLIGLISRHGLSHARVIARRKNINPDIANFIRLLSMKASAEMDSRLARTRVSGPAVEQVRDRLRSLMQARLADGAPDATPDSGRISPGSENEPFAVLRDAALASDPDLFADALARALDVSLFRARRLATAITYSDLLIGLKSLRLSEEQAFLITAAIYPSQVFNGAAMRLFLERYRSLDASHVEERLREWRMQDQTIKPSDDPAHSLAMSR